MRCHQKLIDITLRSCTHRSDPHQLDWTKNWTLPCLLTTSEQSRWFSAWMTFLSLAFVFPAHVKLSSPSLLLQIDTNTCSLTCVIWESRHLISIKQCWYVRVQYFLKYVRWVQNHVPLWVSDQWQTQAFRGAEGKNPLFRIKWLFNHPEAHGGQLMSQHVGSLYGTFSTERATEEHFYLLLA